MCKLIVGVQDKKNTPDFIGLISAQGRDLAMERDGIGALAVLDDGSVRVKRSMDDYNGVLNFAIAQAKNARIVALHSRTSTFGSRDISNVHFFEDNGVYLAHNGFVSGFYSWGNKNKNFGFKTPSKQIDLYGEGYTTQKQLDAMNSIINACTQCALAPDGYCYVHKWAFERAEELTTKLYSEARAEPKDDVEVEVNGHYSKKQKREWAKRERIIESSPSDTLQFLRALNKPMSVSGISKSMKQNAFSGMGFAYDKTSKKSFIFIDKKPTARAVIKENEFSIFFSYIPTTETLLIDTDVVHGVPIERESSYALDLLPLTIQEGVYEMN